MEPPRLERMVRMHTLANAYRHSGKADAKAVVSKIIGESPELRAEVREVISKVEAAVEEVNRMSLQEQLRIIEGEFPELLAERERRVEERRLPPLPNAVEGAVVTRFPPEPNGYPHIGHAKAAVIDETYARMYRGRFILRFDDTNPAKEQIEYYDAIRDGLEWLGVKPDLEKNSSDDMEKFYRYAAQMIGAGSAYVCTCRPAVIKENRFEGRGCRCRDAPVETGLERWRRMFNEYRLNEAILRLKGEMMSPNTALRDPTLFRIIEARHPVQGERYRVWPTYDFAAPIEDSLDGVTHALRTKEYELRDPLYFLILGILHLRRPELIEFARLEMKGTTVSKRKLQPLVREGLVSGWDDPRLPTLIALRRRGILPEAIREFVLGFGVSKVESEPDWSILESFNRKLLDPVAKRYFFVPDPVRLEVHGAPRVTVKLRLHPDVELGEREVATEGVFYISREDAERLSPASQFRLLGLYNVRVEVSEASKIYGVYEGEELKGELPRYQWVTEDHVDFRVWVVKPLMIEGEFNRESLQAVEGYAEAASRELKSGTLVQFTRFGFCRIDAPGRAILAHK